MKNKFISVLIVICFIISLPVTSYAVSGKGTEANPFRISTAEELLLLADFPECYFELENDIEVLSIWEPVAEFSGVFDGKGHTIKVSNYSSYSSGFFDTVTGTVENLVLNSNNLALTSTKPTGLLAGTCSGTIKNCKIIGNATFYPFSGNTNGGKVGGICGELTENGTIENSIIQLDSFIVNAIEKRNIVAGGICYLSSGNVNHCMNLNNSVELNPYKPGYTSVGCVYYGGVTYNNKGIITNCLNLETIEKASYSSGIEYSGITNANSDGTVDCCYVACNMLNLTSSKYGISNYGTMTNCYYDKVLLGTSSTTCGTPKSTLAMKMEATYKDWDFENVWAIDESEENPINDGYPYLKAFYEDVETPITISSLSAVNGKLVIDTKITDISDDYTLHIALYDNQNRLCDYLSIPNERQLKDVFVVYPDNGNATYAKIFTWYSTDNIEPVSTCETVSIER